MRKEKIHLKADKKIKRAISRNKKELISIGWMIISIIAVVMLIFLIEEKIYYIQVENGNFIEDFRQLEFSEETLEVLQELSKDNNLKEAESVIQSEAVRSAAIQERTNWVEYLTAGMLENQFCLEDADMLKNRGEMEFAGEQRLFQQLEKQYQAIFADLKYFPVGEDASGKETCFYENSWYGARTYGGERVHEGTDIMTSNNERGYFPVYSMTDGVVEKMGWLKLGGWRIGIRGPSGGYFYYAHLYKYADGLKEGDTVKAGQLIGYAGDSGYSEVEGTIGKFDVHLHLGIYINDAMGQEISVNPYWVLRFLENRKLRF